MKVVINKEQKDLVISFERFDYTFVPKKAVQIEEPLYNHLLELLPLSFIFEPELAKNTVLAKVHRTPTKNVFPGGRFGIQSTNVMQSADETPQSGKIDGDKIEWYGPGLEDDKP